jgi:hypothetical protein
LTPERTEISPARRDFPQIQLASEPVQFTQQKIRPPSAQKGLYCNSIARVLDHLSGDVEDIRVFALLLCICESRFSTRRVIQIDARREKDAPA